MGSADDAANPATDATHTADGPAAQGVPESLHVKPLVLDRQPATPGGAHLDQFQLKSQKPQSNWCWAANTDAVSTFYKNELKKSDVVKQVISRDTECLYTKYGFSLGSDKCCKELWPLRRGKDGQVVEPSESDEAVYETNSQGRITCGLLLAQHYEDFPKGAFDFEKVKKQIDLGKPLIMHIEWEGGGRHYVAITGYDEGQNLSIADPMSDSAAFQDGHWSTMHIGHAGGDRYYAPEGGAGKWINTGLTVEKQS